MINKIKNSKVIASILLFLMLFSMFSNISFGVNNSVIDTSKKCSLTITKYEHINGNTANNVALSGVEFTIYLINSNIKTVAEAQNYIKTTTITTKANKTTDDTGVVTFTNLPQGRYYVEETKSPENVYEPVKPFLVDLPMTNTAGDKWEYDVKAYPKNVTVYGKVQLVAKNNDGQTLDNVRFKLQQKDKSNAWKDYRSTINLVTDTYGKIVLENLPAGDYRLIPTQTTNGYILDSSNTQNFTIDLTHTDLNLGILVEKPEVKLELLLKNGTYGDHAGAYIEDTTNWKITSFVPTIINKMDTYEIVNKLSAGLTYTANTLQVKGINASGNKTDLIENTDYTYEVDNNLNTITIDFTNDNLVSYKNIEVMYDTKFNDSVIFGRNGNDGSVTLEYTNAIDLEQNEVTTMKTIQDLAEVHTGKILLLKTDGTNALEGAIFRIATSQEKAKKGQYMTDSNGNYIEGISDINGHVIFEGLSYGDTNISATDGKTKYWVVEVQSPTYTDEKGELKHYKLSSDPYEVTITTNSDLESTTTLNVINKKEFELPKTGGELLITTTLSIVLICAGFIIHSKIKNKEAK